MQMRSVASPTGSRTRPSAPGNAIIALALALLTGLTLGQLTLLGGRPFEKLPGRSTEATRTGMDFYDAIDTYLITGQTGELRTLVQPDFIDHIDGRPATSGFSALVRRLEALRGFASEARLSATPIFSSGDLIRFTVSIPPGADAAILGLPVAQTETAVFSETLRIADGRIAERWSDLQLPVAVTSLASIAWDPPGASKMAPAIERLTMLRGSKLTLQLGTAHVVVVESGALTITGTPRGAARSLPEFPPDPAALAAAEPVVALPGSAVFAAGSSPYRITNDGSGVARVLLIRIAGYVHPTDRPAFGEFGTSQNDIGVQIETLSAAIALPYHNGDWTIEIGRATLPPGTAIPAHGVAGSELIFVEQGALDADLDACEKRCIQTVEGVGAFAIARASVQSGQGISVSDSATTSFRVAGSTPATLLIVSVVPSSES